MKKSMTNIIIWYCRSSERINYTPSSTNVNFFCESNKCEFWLKEVSFLGHIISEGGISIDPSKVKDVLSWNTPQNVLDIRSFLGLAR
jgi:hypothetical protein